MTTTAIPKSASPLLRLWRYARGFRLDIILATLYSVLNKLFDLAPPLLIGMAVDVVVQQENFFLARMGFIDVYTQLIVVGFIAILVFGGKQAVSGQLNVGAYSVLIFMTQRLLWPLTRLGATLDLYQRAMASTKRIFGLLDTAPHIIDGRLPLTQVAGDTRFADVHFEYPASLQSQTPGNIMPAVIQDFSLHIPAGQTVALVGPTGAGKSAIVGERGQKLSGGQRQRISIARAVLKDPPALILDEATSSVDNETEAAIQRSLNVIARGRTTILIAHRLSTVRNAHRIFVIHRGRIVESGNHQQLLDADGLYASLWRVQTGDLSSISA